MEFTPLQKHVIALIDEFLRLSIERLAFYQEDFKHLSNLVYAKELNSLEILLPRRSGATTIAHHLCHIHQCLIVVPSMASMQVFEAEHAKMFPEEKPIVTPIHSIKREIKQYLLVSDFEYLRMISEALNKSKVIVFDAFRAYDENSAIKKIMEELGRSHQFIFFR